MVHRGEPEVGHVVEAAELLQGQHAHLAGGHVPGAPGQLALDPRARRVELLVGDRALPARQAQARQELVAVEALLTPIALHHVGEAELHALERGEPKAAALALPATPDAVDRLTAVDDAGVGVLAARAIHRGAELIVQPRPGTGNRAVMRWTSARTRAIAASSCQ